MSLLAPIVRPVAIAANDRLRASRGLLLPPPHRDLNLVGLPGLSGAFATVALSASAKAEFDAQGILRTGPANGAAFAHDPNSRRRHGLRLEGARTNALLRSEDFSNASWTKSGDAAITAAAIAGLDGATTAQKFASAAGTGELSQSVTVPVDSATYIRYWLLKAGTATSVITRQRIIGGTTVLQDVTFNLSTGAAAAGPAGTPSAATNFGTVNLGNGWWLCYQGVTNNGSAGNTTLDTRLYCAGTGIGEFYIDGAQGEIGSFPSSYIATAASAVTRAADAATAAWPLTASASLFVAGRTAPGSGVEQVLAQWDDGSDSNRIAVLRTAGGNLNVAIRSGGAEQGPLDLGAVANDTDFRVAIRAGANDFAASLNGGTIVADTSGTMPAGLVTLRLGAAFGGSAWFGCAARVADWPYPLSNALLQAVAA